MAKRKTIRLQFHIRTLDEAQDMAIFLSRHYPDPDSAFYGLHELLINAIEHGNLGIGYNKKSELLRKGKWRQEVARRLDLKKNSEKHAHVVFESTPSYVCAWIIDHGKGFNWKPYLKPINKSHAGPNGRGIAMARSIAFPALKYLGKGNEVMCKMLRTK